MLKKLLKDKRGFLDPDVLQSPMFLLLGGGALLALLLGWKISKKMFGASFPLWQLLILLVGALVAAYVFAARDN